jgi:hypothetical protein
MATVARRRAPNLLLGAAGLSHVRWLVAAAFAAAGAARGVFVPPLHATVADSARRLAAHGSRMNVRIPEKRGL